MGGGAAGAPGLAGGGGEAGGAMEFRYGSLVTLTDEPIEEVVGIDFIATRAGQPREYHIPPATEENIRTSGAFVGVIHGCGGEENVSPGGIGIEGCQDGALFCIDIVLHEWGALLIYVDGSGESVELPGVLEITLSPSERSRTFPAPPRRAQGSFSASGGRNNDQIEGTFSLLVEDMLLLC